jgi:RHS repeat-associated protein
VVNLSRLTKIDFSTDTDIVYVYDTCVNGKGRLCSMTDAGGTTSYEYTPKGQVKKETKVIDSRTYITQYTYDQNGNMKAMTYPSGKVITYNYTNDRAVSVLNGVANIATNITYKPFGGLSSITYGNGLSSTIGYDTQYRLSTLTTSTFQNLTYGYDNNGNITSITPGKTYTYDSLDRLSTGTGSWGSLGWTYDGVGNRLTENGNTYTYASNTNKLASVNGISFGYDNNGNTTTEGTRQYIYNQNQRLIQVNNGATTAYYTYNGNGQRVKKVVNGITTIFHYSLHGQIIAESNSAGNITAEYVYLNGQPLAKMEGLNTYYYHNDHLGTPQKMTDSSGAVVWSADYKPFGEATITVSTITNNLRFPGQYYDQETGLHYNYFRDYNPSTGRYIEKDPIGLRGGINLYRYALNSPLKWTDIWGLLELSLNGLKLIAGFEGFSAMPYNDVANNATIGYGHLLHHGPVTDAEYFMFWPGMGITEEEGLQILKKDAKCAENTVNKLVKNPLTQNQFDALVSFTYNMGIGNFRNSTLLQVINSGKNADVASELMRWINADGVVYRGLENRRTQEAILFYQ